MNKLKYFNFICISLISLICIIYAFDTYNNVYILYINLPLVILCFFNLKLKEIILIFEKVFKSYVTFISCITFILFVNSLYLILAFNKFILLSFLSVLLISFVLICKHLNISNKFINNIKNKDFSYYFKRIMIIKFLFLYIYVISDHSYCGSLLTETMSNLFSNKTNHVCHCNTKTSDTWIQTAGTLLLVGSVSFFSIKAYQYFVESKNDLINQRLHNIEYKFDRMNQNLNTIENNVKLTNENIEIINKNVKEHYNADIELQKSIALNNVNDLQSVGSAIFSTNENLNNISKSIIDNQNTLNANVISHQNVLNESVKNELNQNKQCLEILLKKYKDIPETSINLSPQEKEELQRLNSELSQVLERNGKTLDTIPSSSSNVALKPSSEIFEEEVYKRVPCLRPKNNLSVPFYPNPHNSSLDKYSKLSCSNINQNVNNIKKDLAETKSSTITSNDTVSNNTLDNLEVGKIYKLTEVSDSNIVFTAIAKLGSTISSNLSNAAFSTTDMVCRRVFSFGADAAGKVLSIALSKLLENSINYSVFSTIFKIITGNNAPSNAENLGYNLKKTIKDFINGITK